MNKEQIIQVYLMNSPRVVAEMLYDTIERYEHKLDEVNQLLEDSVLPDKVEQDVIDEVLAKVMGIGEKND